MRAASVVSLPGYSCAGGAAEWVAHTEAVLRQGFLHTVLGPYPDTDIDTTSNLSEDLPEVYSICGGGDCVLAIGRVNTCQRLIGPRYACVLTARAGGCRRRPARARGASGSYLRSSPAPVRHKQPLRIHQNPPDQIRSLHTYRQQPEPRSRRPGLVPRCVPLRQ